MTEKINVLILEDNPSDAELMLIELRRAGYAPDYQIVDNKKEFTACLKPELDLILSDYSLPQFNGLQALQMRNESGFDIPFIIISGTIGEEVAVESIQQGADDYLMKDRMKRLGEAVKKAVKEKGLRDEKRQSEQMLQESETRFKNIAESMSDWIWEVNAEAVYTYCSEEEKTHLGYTVDEIIGKTPFDFLDPSNLEDVRTAFGKFVSEKRSFRDLENWNITKDGQRKCLLTSGVPILSQNNDFLGYRGVDKDITERKQAEEALRGNEEKFRNVFESANVGKSITFLSGEINVNRSFAEMLGYEKEELAHRTWQELTPVDELEAVQAKIDLLPSGKQDSIRFEKRFIHKDGSHIWADVNTTIQRDHAGKPLYFITTVININEKKLAEFALRKSEQFQKTIFETTALPTGIIEEDTTISMVNRAFEDLSGYSKEEIEGKKS